MSDSIFDGIDKTVATSFDTPGANDLSQVEFSKLADRAMSMSPRPPMTEEEMVSKLSPKNQRAYANLMRGKRRQFRWLRKELFRRTIG